MTAREQASSAEKTVLEFLEGRDAEILQFARDLIATPSPNPPGDERAVADLVTAKLAELGITDVERVGASVERPNLIVRVPGSGNGSTLMLSGHLDTKPAGDMDAWETDPWDPVLRDGDLIGLGCGDMKAAVSGMVYAAAAVAAVPDRPGDLVVVFTADEEAGSVVGSKWMAEEGLLEADIAVIGEPSGIFREWEAIHLISRGAALFKVKVSGTQMHSSISDRIKGINATVQMARLIDRMDRELEGYLTFEPHPLCPTGPTVNIGVMAEAGVFYGVYPGNAEFACDLRTIPGMGEEQLIADIQRFLDDAMADEPDLRAELVWELMVPATEIAPDEPIVGFLQGAAEDVLGSAPQLDAFPGATDAPHFQLTAGVPCVAAFGPGMLPRAHSPNEYMAATGAAEAANVYGLAAIRYLEGTT
jgi:acetylornithine deacetylase